MYIEAHIGRPQEASPHAVRIELDDPAAQYQPGEPISGRVVVLPAFDDHCDALSIELQLYAHGWVSSVAVAAEQRLFGGPLRAGVAASFPFRLAAPRTAGPYHGHLLHLELRLAAVLLLRREQRDLIGALAGVNRREWAARAYPAGARAITVMHDTRPMVVSIDPEKARRALGGRGAKVAAGCSFVLIALAGVAAGSAMWFLDVSDILFQSLAAGLGFILGLIGALLLYQNLGVWMAQRKIGVPDIAVVTRDGFVDASLRLQAGVPVDAIHATIRALEHMSRSHGSSTDTREHVVAEQALTLQPGAQPGVFGIHLPLSALAGFPPTFGMPAARIVWRLRLRIELPLWPDWEDEVPLEAYPGGDRQSTTVNYVLTFD